MDFITDYQEEFNEIAYRILSEKGLRTKIHVCSELRCSKSTLELWIKENKNFKAAIELGLIDGEVRFRDKISRLATSNSSKVNTKMLMVLANNVYDIKDELQTIIIDNKGLFSTPIDNTMTPTQAAAIYTGMIKEEGEN